MARLHIVTPEGSQLAELRPQNSLGRHPSNSIQVLDKIVSKEHCLIELRGTVYVVRDLGSLNGTYINGERVRGEQALRHGDQITMGSSRIHFEDGAQARPAPPAAPGPTPSGAVPSAGGHWSPQPPHAHQGAGWNTAPAPSRGSVAPPSLTGAHNVGSASPASGVPSGAHAVRRPPPAAPSGTQAIAMPQASGGTHPLPPVPATPAAPPQPVLPPQVAWGTGAAPPRRPGTMIGTRVDLLDSARAIERQIAARTKGFQPFDQLSRDPNQLGLDYERLRITWELSRDIGTERDVDVLLEKILRGLFKFVRADRGVALLREADGSLQPRATHRRDGTEAPIEVSSTILNHVIREKASVLTHDATSDFAASKGKSMILNRISSAMVVPLLHEQQVLGALWLDSASLAQFGEKDLEVVTTVASQAAMFVENILLTKKIEQEITARERFSRLLSPNVAEQVLNGKLEVKKGGVQVPDCTVFNSDIRGFTAMSEGTSAAEMVEILNEYFEHMVETIFKYEGTLDKFMGDGIMAFWGAPVVQADDAVRAVDSALEQMQVLDAFNRRRHELGLPSLHVGMGLHTGPLVAGYVGSSKALSYTVIGDTANTSARLCGIAAAGQILVSEQTLAQLGDRFEYEELAPAALKGKEKPLRVFNILRAKPSATSASGATP